MMSQARIHIEFEISDMFSVERRLNLRPVETQHYGLCGLGRKNKSGLMLSFHTEEIQALGS